MVLWAVEVAGRVPRLLRGGEAQLRVLRERVGNAPGHPGELQAVAGAGALQAEAVLDVPPVPPPVLQLNPQDVIPLAGDGVDLLEAQPEFLCKVGGKRC